VIVPDQQQFWCACVSNLVLPCAYDVPAGSCPRLSSNGMAVVFSEVNVATRNFEVAWGQLFAGSVICDASDWPSK
jgi:hypothetical protein